MHFTPSSVVLASLAVAQAVQPGSQITAAPQLKNRQNVSKKLRSKRVASFWDGFK